MKTETVRMASGAAGGQAPAAGNTAAGRVGDELRARREALGWDLGEIATALRIRLPYLEAIERGDLKAVPGNAYALGFLRSYANILGLDPEPLCRRFRSEARDVNRKPELAFPAPMPERGVPAGAAVLVGLVVIGLVYAGWYRLSSHSTVAAQSVPSLPAPAVTAGGTPTPPTAQQPTPAVASVLPDGQAARPPSVLPQIAAETPAPAVSPAPTPVPPATPEAAAPTQAATPQQAPPVAPPVQQAQASPPAAPAVAPGEVALVAKAASWVQVRRDGHVLYDHTMQPGERWVLPPGTGQAVMTVGNAGGLAIATGGVEAPALGRDGAVMRNVKLGGEDTAPQPMSPQAAFPPAVSAAPPATPQTAPQAVPPATAGVAGLPGDFSGSGAKVVRPHHPKPAAPAPHEPSADDLNSMQLQQHRAAPPAGEP